MLKRIGVEHLRFGMYLHELCGSGIEESALLQADARTLVNVKRVAMDDELVRAAKICA